MIRKASLVDLKDIYNLLEQILHIHYQMRPDLYKKVGSKYSETELAKLLEKENFYIFVKELDKRVVGHIMCQVVEQEEDLSTKACKTLYIDDLCVDEAYRHLSIGKELVNRARTLARELGCYNITLHVNALNFEAIAFYEHLGLKMQSHTMEEIL